MSESNAPGPKKTSTSLGAEHAKDVSAGEVAIKKIASILCVEDDHETASLIKEELEERGFAVTVVGDGARALSILTNMESDLILCDINMPGISGFQVLEELTKLTPRLSRVPFIFLTALGDRDNELKGRSLGADDYISKPIDFDLLHQIIVARLEGVGRLKHERARCVLNERESVILKWAARGKTSDEIAIILSITKRTIDFHLDNARTKLGVATRVEAAVKATVLGLIEP